MLISDKNLKQHPGLNPAYFSGMKARRDAQNYNGAAGWMMRLLKVPPQPNRYIPHYGAKEAAKYLARSGRAD